MNTMVPATAEQGLPDAGDLILWILVWSELAVFGLLFCAFAVTGIIQANQFSAAQEHLNAELAALNTAILLTSGWQAAKAAKADMPPQKARRALIAAALLGFGFVAIKFIEYSGEIPLAADAAYGTFFELYFMLTGFHLLHVFFGAMILLLVAWRMTRPNIIMITTLWHVFDLIWIMMFPLVYLASQA